MTLRTPPSWLQNGSHPAENDRLSMQAIFATTGIIGTSSMAVTANTPVGMSVRVAQGWAGIVGTTQANMGVYTVYNDATAVLTVTASDPTNPRIDRVVVTVQDAYYSGAFNDVIFQVIAGTPASSPTAPATPADSISLATIAVAATATQINTGDITDTRVEVTTNLPQAGDITSVTAGAGLAGGGSSGAVTLSANIGINAQTGTTYTAAITDDGKLVTLNNASAITVSIPTNAVTFPVGAQISFAWITGAGQPTIQALTPGTTTILSTGATTTAPKLRTTNSVASCVKIAAETWIITGDII